ncbi:hypothetical protein HBH70_162000 [Parastagonospora nodorum]|nr:hypothetical protein HBH70_162000 [Parastagonospora nodorum]KAH5309751.1 hypothetical protein HBI12_150690 [Parastagonospora nodorum]KAH5401536.1 hypothetical protein HBI32_172030 [Parastagonospora nodorum]KAH5418485.1 hypothetical protein HBI47_140260 [Parastagonospora nodorum]KAH6001910.1 hypothetical protein HBI82_157530 [Parastagonospora nodorum]
MEGQDSEQPDAAYSKAKASKFSFKSKSSRRSKRSGDDSEGQHSPKRHHTDRGGGESRHSHRESRRRHKHKHRSSREDTHPTSTRDGEYYDPDHRHRESLFDDLDEAHTTSPRQGVEDAFRESLFDALADDEGAAYWEGVYGQPVHIYPDTKPGPDGKLERMTEEEYAEYVRGKMWEKSHQHIIEEREARERARKKKKEQRDHLHDDVSREEKEREQMRRQMAESLKRGAERKKAKEKEAAWSMYEKKWEELKSAQSIAQDANVQVCDLVPWPVCSGKVMHVSKEEIEDFLRSSRMWKVDPAALLKIERVRWHPDKMQQRFGQHIDADTMRSVTAVFQVIDRLWNERR